MTRAYFEWRIGPFTILKTVDLENRILTGYFETASCEHSKMMKTEQFSTLSRRGEKAHFFGIKFLEKLAPS